MNDDTWDSLPRPGWQASAACAGHDPAWWFPSPAGAGSSPEARRVCARCEVADDCLAFALRHEKGGRPGRCGIFGGMNPLERERFAHTLVGAGMFPGAT